VIATTAEDLGAILRDARQARKLTQSELATMIGVSRQWVISAEKGAPTARIDLMLDALRCVDMLVDVVGDDSGETIDAVFGADGGADRGR
jgi:DNA-binding XRE family transcriptional regulator